jgi:hypothetical protein
LENKGLKAGKRKRQEMNPDYAKTFQNSSKDSFSPLITTEKDPLTLAPFLGREGEGACSGRKKHGNRKILALFGIKGIKGERKP